MVYDVVIDDVSIVGNYRSQCARILGGIDHASVSQERSGIRDRLKNNATAKRWLRELEELLIS